MFITGELTYECFRLTVTLATQKLIATVTLASISAVIISSQIFLMQQ